MQSITDSQPRTQLKGADHQPRRTRGRRENIDLFTTKRDNTQSGPQRKCLRCTSEQENRPNPGSDGRKERNNGLYEALLTRKGKMKEHSLATRSFTSSGLAKTKTGLATANRFNETPNTTRVRLSKSTWLARTKNQKHTNKLRENQGKQGYWIGRGREEEAHRR